MSSNSFQSRGSDDSFAYYEQAWDEDQRRRLEQDADVDNTVFSYFPSAQKLGRFTVACLISNRIIGNGIFTVPGEIYIKTGSVGITFVLWAVSTLLCFSGLVILTEFGLSVPQYRMGDSNTIEPIPRSGGEKNYLEFVYRKPARLIQCVYGITYIIFANTSGNAITFAVNILTAAGRGENKTEITGISIGVVGAACLIHGTWRKGGIWLNNGVAVIKFCFLLMTVLLAIKGRANPPEDGKEVVELHPSGAFSDVQSSAQPGTYARCMLLVFYTLNGFEQANYVLSEIKTPRKTLPQAAIGTYLVIAILYFGAVFAFLGRMTSAELDGNGLTLCIRYYEALFGKESKALKPVISFFVALSSFGNIVVVTFVASKVKQEIAKEGILPFSQFFMKDMYSPMNHIWNILQSTPQDRCDEESDRTPIPALFLHFLFSVVMILIATQGMPPHKGVFLLFTLYPYSVNVLCGIFLSAGLIWLYLNPKAHWKDRRGINPPLGILWPILYGLGTIAMTVAIWWPQESEGEDAVAWYVAPLWASLVFFGLGPLYWIIFEKVHLRNRVFSVTRIAIVSLKDRVQISESVTIKKRVPDPEGLAGRVAEGPDHDVGKMGNTYMAELHQRL